jgi:uncharacterized membrane protein YgaE (UPF0421/DUF939 family)
MEADVIKIGMRNLKTSLSVFICLLVFEVINRGNSIFACIAAVICVQNTIVDSKETGITRIIGTIIGGLAGAFSLFIVNTFFSEKILIIIIPLGIMILIKICVTINMKKAVVICCVVFLVVMISMNPEEGYILYTFNRVLDTSIGIIIALLVNKYAEIPEKLKTKFSDNEELTETDIHCER